MLDAVHGLRRRVSRELARAAPISAGAARALRLLGDVEPREIRSVVLLSANVFVLLVAYYVLKTAREPLVLASGAEMKSYAAAAQALVLAALVPAFGWVSSRLRRARLAVAVVLVSVGCLAAFSLLSHTSVPHLGLALYVFVGVLGSVGTALFWSVASDLHCPAAGERLFPVIGIGAALGGPVGSKLAERLFARNVGPYEMLHVAAALFLVQAALYALLERREPRAPRSVEHPRPLAAGRGGFALIWSSSHVRRLAAIAVLVNVVNTTGEYVLGGSVLAQARAAAAANPGVTVAAFVGAFYGRYFFWANVGAVALQALLVSRVVKRAGPRGVLLALPLVAFGAYALVAARAGMRVLQWAKTAENAVDYSFMSTAKNVVWLPASRDEKYKAKQVVDTLFVRAGDVVAAGAIVAGTRLGATAAAFGMLNVVLAVGGAVAAMSVASSYERLARSASLPGDLPEVSARA